jgi:site-specific DNA-methyltransferase (adenine-specific)
MTNRIYFGDNLPILKSLPGESIDLIYIDPPFNTKKVQKRTTIKTIQDNKGDRKGFKGNTYRTVELGIMAYQDSFDSYIDGFLRPRIKEAYRLLKPHGSLYFHIDYREVHYCKILLDDIFGRDSFLNEIIWAYDYGGRARSKWPAKHDNILFYAKNPEKYIFNTGAIDREPYMAPGLVGPEKAKKGKLPTDTWYARFVGTKEDETDPWWMDYFFKGSNTATWQTIIPTSSKERVGYPTQKPLRLINRIIKASSLPGSVVLDFFAGSGTVGESCLELKRDFVLIDSNNEALEVMAQRFNGVKGIKWINFDPKPYQNKKIYTKTNSDIKIPAISSEFLMLAATASYLQQELQENSDLWKDSPFEWVLQLPARKKGKLGRELLSSWLSNKGLSVESTKDSSEMLFIKGFRVAIKFSTMWTKGYYRFQQIRSSGYDYIICLGISPLQAHCWVFSRNYAIEHATLQHKDEYWMPINPKTPPEWAEGHGGTLEDAYEILEKLKPKA